ncbi:TIGR03085 family metal-binding protein [Cumulibacter manganitolerans]|uniref:TIGR03085 family metal-binding protein n=1 Tax=Cumulibacter manganitolerans TaxID=1884992 RepID=UPI001295C801|nr:TIGR03085 family metal-binding protein [Cumulibacter manganitolerans]
MAANIAQAERRALCDLFDELGPDAPTLCEGWATRDLAAHLAVREGRPDAAPGVLIPAFAGYTQKVREQLAALPWPVLVERIRTGPPALSVFRLPGLDAKANLGEFFIHHEDVRRAQPGWAPRDADGERYRALEGSLMRIGRFLLRKSPVTVRLDPGTGQPFVARASRNKGGVTVVGTPDELALWCYGREDVARVELIGDEADIEALLGSARGF